MAEPARKYHINPKTGNPNICRATKRACPLGMRVLTSPAGSYTRSGGNFSGGRF